ncbi:zinc-binding dehydrogenase [Microbacterium sp. NPDC089695]|uniref:zinc-binding dehydrogenase n=1 Tax=Microbacterium sp. NPDC089695 TaxID=3364198 RepID=UPI00381CC2D3
MVKPPSRHPFSVGIPLSSTRFTPTMHAIVIDHSEPSHLRLADTPEPVPAAHDALIAVTAVSVNPGDVAALASAEEGSVPGWESAGVVVQAASDGSGPAVGAHVTGFDGRGGWAPLRAIPTSQLGTVPSALDAAEASTLPIAASSALRAIRTLGGVVGRRLLVVGATGAVGRFAVQIGASAGAEIIAVARDESRHPELRSLGAADTWSTIGSDRPSVHHALDTVGGAQLAEAFRLLRAHGTLVSVGRASGEPTMLSADDLIADQGRSGIRLRTFFLAEDLDGYSDDIAWLGVLAADGRLSTDIRERVPFDALPTRLERPLNGKLVAVL